MQSLDVPLHRTKALFCGLVQFLLLNDSMSCAVLFQEQLRKKERKNWVRKEAVPQFLMGMGVLCNSAK